MLGNGFVTFIITQCLSLAKLWWICVKLHALYVFILFLILQITSCTSSRLGYVLERVAMDQDQYEQCDPSSVPVYALSAEEILDQCGNWLGCIRFRQGPAAAVIYYRKGFPEILQHEMNHCIVGGPFHVSDVDFSIQQVRIPQ